jgi:hypothetical protein
MHTLCFLECTDRDDMLLQVVVEEDVDGEVWEELRIRARRAVEEETVERKRHEAGDWWTAS